MALPIGPGELDKRRILEALRLTFNTRGTHDLVSLVPPPAHWQIPFQALAGNVGSRQILLRCLPGFRSSSKRCWHSAQRGERGMTGNGSPPPIKPPEPSPPVDKEERVVAWRFQWINPTPALLTVGRYMATWLVRIGSELEYRGWHSGQN